MLAEAFASVKRRYFGGSAPARPRIDVDGRADADRGHRSETASTDGDSHPLQRTPNEEILALLEANDGRIEQGDVVDSLPWSPATVSRRLGELEAEGRVVRYPVGRRKIVCLPDCKPAAARSPFEG